MSTVLKPTSSFTSTTIEDLASEPPRGRTLKRKVDVPEEQARQQIGSGKRRKVRNTQTDVIAKKKTGKSMSSHGSARRQSQPRTPMDDRPILQPTPPSTILNRSLLSRSRSRSSSPVRQTIKLLEKGLPPVQLKSPSSFGGLASPQPPAVVAELRRLLVRDAATGIIPESVRDGFRAYASTTFDETPESAFAAVENYEAIGIPVVWESVKDIESRARKCMQKHKDESAWCQVVESVLSLALTVNKCTSRSDEMPLEINNIESQSIDPAFLPRIRTAAGRIDSVVKKSDFALGVELDDAGSSTLLPLSPMIDAYTSTIPLLSAIGVKRHGGSAEEAELQLMVWQASALAHLQFLREKGGVTDSQSLPPVVGWTVEGHSWSFYIAWMQEDGAVTVMGPFSPSNAGTSNITSVFVLLSLWTRLIAWLKSVYYPVYQKLLLQAIEKHNAQIAENFIAEDET